MIADKNTRCTAFCGLRKIASGVLSEVALAAKRVFDTGDSGAIAIFDDAASRPIEIDFRGTLDDVRRRVEAVPTSEEAPVEGARGPGRPKLGVVAREVTLLPRHWDWLAEQPGGASVALRKLVDEARRANEGPDRIRGAQTAANRFMTAMAGDEPGFEEASRALFAGDGSRFDAFTAGWPADVRDYARQLAAPAFGEEAA